MSFNAYNRNIYELLNRNYFEIPRNQRKYVWNKKNWEEFYADILFSIKVNKSHFIGSIVLKDEGRNKGLPTYTVIDGQQRITTITLALSAVVYLMRQAGMEDDFRGTQQYLIAKDDKNHKVVMISSENHGFIEKLIKTVTSEQTEAISGNIQSLCESLLMKKQDKIIAEAFKFFVMKIQDNEKYKHSRGDLLLELRDAIVGITYVSIISSTDEDSYTIFEILNARGMDLEDHELLKNYIMRYMLPIENRDNAKQIWEDIEEMLRNNISRFIKHYTVHKFGYDKDLSDYKQIQESTDKLNVNELLYDLREKAELYLRMVSPNTDAEYGNCTETEFFVYDFFKRKRYWQMRPVLLSLMSQYKKGNLDQKLYEKTILYLRSFYICYNIIGEQNSNKLTNCVNKYASIIENSFSEDNVNKFIDELCIKMPSYEAFYNSFKTIGWSHRHGFYEGEKNKDKVQTVLEIVERYKNDGICLEGFTIEHIYDDCESKDNALIGNLLPLEDSLNRRCIGKSFKEKCDIYRDSNYKMTRNFANRQLNKDNFKISTRTELLSKEIYDNILKWNK